MIWVGIMITTVIFCLLEGSHIFLLNKTCLSCSELLILARLEIHKGNPTYQFHRHKGCMKTIKARQSQAKQEPGNRTGQPYTTNNYKVCGRDLECHTGEPLDLLTSLPLRGRGRDRDSSTYLSIKHYISVGIRTVRRIFIFSKAP